MYVCVCMHVCMHICTCEGMHVCMHISMYVCMYAYMHVCMHPYVHICTCESVHVCMQDIFKLLIFSDLVVTLELNFVLFANKPKVYRFKAFLGCFGLVFFFFFSFFFTYYGPSSTW